MSEEKLFEELLKKKYGIAKPIAEDTDNDECANIIGCGRDDSDIDTSSNECHRVDWLDIELARRYTNGEG